MSTEQFDYFTQHIANIDNFHIVCEFDKSGKVTGMQYHPMIDEIVNLMLTYKDPPMKAVFVTCAAIALQAHKNGSDAKSCNFFFEAITAAVAALNNIDKGQYHLLLADSGYYGKKQ